jgi:hypothetical protein
MKRIAHLYQILRARWNSDRAPAGGAKIALALGLLLTLSSTMLLISREAKSQDNLQLEGYGLEGSWINTVSPILPPGAPPVTFQTMNKSGETD